MEDLKLVSGLLKAVLTTHENFRVKSLKISAGVKWVFSCHVHVAAPRESQVNIKGDWWWASWLWPQCWSSSRQRLHILNICTWNFQSWIGKTDVIRCLPVSSKSEKEIFQNQSEINVYVKRESLDQFLAQFIYNWLNNHPKILILSSLYLNYSVINCFHVLFVSI